MTHEEILADLSTLALGSLDPEERREIEHHLTTGCADCRREMARWREVVGLMALEAQDGVPPDLKSQLLRRVRPGSRKAAVIRLRRSVLIPLAAAAAVLLVFGIVRDRITRRELDGQRQLVISLRGELGVVQDNLQRLTHELAAREKDLTSLRAALASAQESLAILQAPGLRMVELKHTAEAPPAQAHALISTGSGRALFYAFDLPPTPEHKAYELWWITEKEGPVNAGVFHPDDRGLGRVETIVPANAGAIQAAAVTIEPDAGVPKPTGPMVLLGKL